MKIFGFELFGTGGVDTGSPIADVATYYAGVNPATGLPLLDDSGIDAAGNVFGTGEPGGAMSNFEDISGNSFDSMNDTLCGTDSFCGGDDFGCDF